MGCEARRARYYSKIIIMTDKIIIGLVGEIASGKDTVVEYLIKKYQATAHKFSTPLRDVLKRLYLDVSRENMQEVSRILREKFGQNLLAKVITEDVRNDSNKIVVVNGIRRFADIQYLKDLPEFKLVHINTDARICYERLIKRRENVDDTNKTFEQFQRDHEAETEKEIAEVAKSASYSINNNGTLEELYQQIDGIVNKL